MFHGGINYKLHGQPSCVHSHSYPTEKLQQTLELNNRAIRSLGALLRRARRWWVVGLLVARKDYWTGVPGTDSGPLEQDLCMTWLVTFFLGKSIKWLGLFAIRLLHWINNVRVMYSLLLPWTRALNVSLHVTQSVQYPNPPLPTSTHEFINYWSAGCLLMLTQHKSPTQKVTSVLCKRVDFPTCILVSISALLPQASLAVHQSENE